MAFRWGRRRSTADSPGQSSLNDSSSTPHPRRDSNASVTGSIGTATVASEAAGQIRQPPRASHAIDQLRGRTRGATVNGLPPIRQTATGVAAAAASARRPSVSGVAPSSAAFGTVSAPAYPGQHPAETASVVSGVRSATPPAYAIHQLDRAPLPNPMALDDRPRVPPPIFLRSNSTQPQSKSGSITIHVPGWGVALVRPPRAYDLHPLEVGAEGGGREPPAEDTVLTGSIEVVMRERRRVRAISVGVQGVSRLNMGVTRGWEEDGIFERGVEVLSGDDEGIWLEKGSQSYSFSILLPATLATYDYHGFGRVSYIISARVEGIGGNGRLGSLFKSRDIPVQGPIPFLADFQAVISRSDRVAAEQAAQISSSKSREGSPALSPFFSDNEQEFPFDEVSAFALGDSGPVTPSRGLFHRRSSADLSPALAAVKGANGIPGAPAGPSPLRRDTDTSSITSHSSSSNGTDTNSNERGWLQGDICAYRALKVHANPSPNAGVTMLDLRKEGAVTGLGPWRFSASSDALTIAGVMIVQLTIPQPGPDCSIFFVRLMLAQNYTLHSPRTPNAPPHKPEAPKNHVVYQVGRPHRHGESVLDHSVQALWRGTKAGGKNPEPGYRTRAVARLPNHEKMRPSTNPGSITSIRVTHELLLRIFYSVEGETVQGTKIPGGGPGEVRMCQVRFPITIPSCCCSTATLNLPTYEHAKGTAMPDTNDLNPKIKCQCETSFAELSASAMRRTAPETEADEEWARRHSTEEESGGGSVSGRSKGREAAAGG